MGHHDDKSPDERVVEYIYGELSPADAARFEAEMERDPALASEVRDLQAVAHLAAETVDPIPEPPEAAIAEAMAAARARCDKVQGAELTLWERISAWLMTPQLAGALTLVLVVSVGIYTLETGVFDRDAAEAPSVKHEMAPVGPSAEAEEAKEAPEAARPAPARKATAATEPRRELASVAAAKEEEAAAEPAPTDQAASPQPPAPEPAEEPPAETTEAEDPQAATRLDDAAKSNRWQDDGEARARGAERGFRTLTDLVAPGEIAADKGLEAAEDTPAKALQVEGRKETGTGEVRAEVNGDAGNFVEKSARKPDESMGGKSAGFKQEKKRIAKKRGDTLTNTKKKKKETKATAEKAKKAEQVAADATVRDKDASRDRKINDMLRRTKKKSAERPKKSPGRVEKKPEPPRAEGKKDAVSLYKKSGAQPAPKVTRSVLDGIVVPPSPAPERVDERAATREEVPVVLSMDVAEKAKTGSVISGTDGADSYLGGTTGSGGDATGIFDSNTGLDEGVSAGEDTEPTYLIRPEAAEAPGVGMARTERPLEVEKKRPAATPGPATTASVQAKVADDEAPASEVTMTEGMENDLDAVEEEAFADIASKVAKEEVQAPKDEQAICAALAKAIEEAEEAEDWGLAGTLTEQFLARGCVADNTREATEKAGASVRQKAIEADFAAPTDDAPTAEKAPPVGELPTVDEVNEPTEKK